VESEPKVNCWRTTQCVTVQYMLRLYMCICSPSVRLLLLLTAERIQLVSGRRLHSTVLQRGLGPPKNKETL